VALGSIPEVQAHSFLTSDGARARVSDARDPHLEVNGVTLEPCYITGPEILKLAEQGRALREALLVLLTNPGHHYAKMAARAALDQTASTFGQDESGAGWASRCGAGRPEGGPEGFGQTVFQCDSRSPSGERCIQTPRHSGDHISENESWRDEPDATPQEPPRRSEACGWEQTDDYSGCWESDCGLTWIFEEGGPSENEMRFCCGCGLPLTEKRWFQPEEDEEDDLDAALVGEVTRGDD